MHFEIEPDRRISLRVFGLKSNAIYRITPSKDFNQRNKPQHTHIYWNWLTVNGIRHQQSTHAAKPISMVWFAHCRQCMSDDKIMSNVMASNASASPTKNTFRFLFYRYQYAMCATNVLSEVLHVWMDVSWALGHGEQKMVDNAKSICGKWLAWRHWQYPVWIL